MTIAFGIAVLICFLLIWLALGSIAAAIREVRLVLEIIQAAGRHDG